MSVKLEIPACLSKPTKHPRCWNPSRSALTVRKRSIAQALLPVLSLDFQRKVSSLSLSCAHLVHSKSSQDSWGMFFCIAFLAFLFLCDFFWAPLPRIYIGFSINSWKHSHVCSVFWEHNDRKSLFYSATSKNPGASNGPSAKWQKIPLFSDLSASGQKSRTIHNGISVKCTGFMIVSFLQISNVPRLLNSGSKTLEIPVCQQNDNQYAIKSNK